MKDPEIGVYDSELYCSEKYDEWLELRENQLKLYPNDYHTKYRFAEALIFNNKNELALEFLKKVHDEEPEEEEFNQLILDALRKSNQQKEKFNWKIIPKTLSLDEEVELLILKNLKSKRKRKQKFMDTFLSLLDYLIEFDEIGLYNYLRTSERFNVQGASYYDAIIERI